MAILAFILILLGALIAALNFYLSFPRYLVHHIFHKGQPYKFVSGIPLIGSLLLWVGVLLFLLGGAWKYAALAFIISLFDTGGIHWFFITLGYHWLVDWRANGEA